MKTGTKSILFGYHQFLLHPLMVAIAWWKLYGFPWHPLLWLSFFVHDIGYIGKEMMDDEIGESHPEVGAAILSFFDKTPESKTSWSSFVLYHSRFYSLRDGVKYSNLCVADKLAFLLYPNWLIQFLYFLSGEGKEYAAIAEKRGMAIGIQDTIQMWKGETRKWLVQHEKGGEDVLTKQLKALDGR